MRTLIPVFLLSAAFSLLPAQSLRTQPPASLAHLQRYLGLTPAQVNLILQTNRFHTQWLAEKEVQINNQRVAIDRKTKQNALDTLEVGTHYGNLMAICGDIRNVTLRLREHHRQLLTEGQQAKLATLQEALQTVPAIRPAQVANLLDVPSSLPGSGVDVSSVPACVAGTLQQIAVSLGSSDRHP